VPNLSISSEKVCFLIVKAREFDVQDVETDEEEGSNPSDDREIDVLEENADNPVAQEIGSVVEALNADEQADLLALVRLGRGDGGMGEWEGLREHAGRVAAYLMGKPLLSDYLEEGLSQFGFSCAEFEIDRL